jgi:hypothetical protein
VKKKLGGPKENSSYKRHMGQTHAEGIVINKEAKKPKKEICSV